MELFKLVKGLLKSENNGYNRETSDVVWILSDLIRKHYLYDTYLNQIDIQIDPNRFNPFSTETLLLAGS